MAHFYGDLQGSRGATSRMGSKDSGMDAHIRGWNVGCRVVCRHEDGKDVVYIYRTGGSNGHRQEVLIQKIVEGE